MLKLGHGVKYMIEIIPNWHPLLVHFTIALFSVSIALFVLSKVLEGSALGNYFLVTAKLNLWIGAGFSVLTGLAGFEAFNTVAHDTPSHAAMTEHRNWAIATLLVFAVLTIWSAFVQGIRAQVNILFLLVGIIGVSLLMTTGYKGAEVVYRYGLGVMSLPKTEGEGHAHDHGAHAQDPLIIQSKDMKVPDDMLMSDDMIDNGKKNQHVDGHNHTH